MYPVNASSNFVGLNRQECEENADTNFFYVASFCNKKLFHHICQSFMQMDSK